MDFYSIRSFTIVCLLVSVLYSPSLVYGGQTNYEGDETVREGGTFSISCFLTLFDPVNWEKDGVPISFDPMRQNAYTFVEETVGGKVKASVIVKAAQFYHTGSYRCNNLTNESHFLYVISDGLISTNLDYKGDNLKVLDYGEKLELQCNQTNPQPGQIVKWFKLDKPVVTSEGDKPNIVVTENSLIINRAMEDEVSNYSCKMYNTKQSNTTPIASQLFYVVGRPYVKLPETVTVIEGEKLKLECTVIGGPGLVTVEWRVGNISYSNSTGRVTLSTGKNPNIQNNLMELEPAEMNDRGDVSCKADNLATTVKDANVATVYIRVKDKYAALWPFLGIVAEVIVLCTVIFIYEKKRNKAELDESDTDQSPEQKHTPDHGKDSVRQRK